MNSKNFNNIYKKINELNLLFNLLKTQINSTQSSVSTFLSLNNKNKISRQ